MIELRVDLNAPCKTTNATCTSYEYWGWIGGMNNRLTVNGKDVYWSSSRYGGGTISNDDAEEIQSHLIAIREILKKRGVKDGK